MIVCILRTAVCAGHTATNESTLESDMNHIHKKSDVLNNPSVWNEELKSRMIKSSWGRAADKEEQKIIQDKVLE